MLLRDYAYSDDGQPIVGATVEAYQEGQALPAASTTTDSNGMWQFTTLSAGHYRVRLLHGSSVRWLRGQVASQFERVTGLDGSAAPLGNASVTAAMLRSNVVPDHVVSFNDAEQMASNSGMLRTILGAFAGLLKSITGKPNWWEAPDTSLGTLAGQFQTHRHDGVDAPYLGLTFPGAGLGSDIAFSSIAWVAGPALTLTPGVYLLLGQALIETTSGGGAAEIRLSGGGTVFGFAAVRCAGMSSGAVLGKATLAAETTITLQARKLAAEPGGASVLKVQSPVDNTIGGTTLMALRVG